MKTIRQIADEIGVSKQAIQKKISREPLYTCLHSHVSILNGIKYIDEKGVLKIKSSYNQKDKHIVSIDNIDSLSTEKTQNVYSLIEVLKSELEYKNSQLEKKDEQIEILNKSLLQVTLALQEAQQTANAAQALHAGTMQKQIEDGISEKYKEEIVDSVYKKPEKKHGFIHSMFFGKSEK